MPLCFGRSSSIQRIGLSGDISQVDEQEKDTLPP